MNYNPGGQPVRALDHISMDVFSGTSTAIVGRSGSGKSTLTSVLSLLRRPTHGTVLVRGKAITSLSDARLSELRAAMVGTVFQSFHLDQGFTAEGNVMLPWYFTSSGSRRQARSRAQQLLEVVGIPELANRYPSEMSGGQRQRIAIARALFADPPLLIADEPTGNLDEDTATVIADVLYALPERLSSAVVVVTHDREVAARANRLLHIARGQLSKEQWGAESASAEAAGR